MVGAGEEAGGSGAAIKIGGVAMRTRNKKYRDYGFDDAEEAKRLVQYCRSDAFDMHNELLNSAISANADLAYDIIYTIVYDISYDDLCKIRTLPINKNDFYAYRRKALANMKNWMLFHNVQF